MLLDDKCRKQVDTFKQGGTITERRKNWAACLRSVLPNMRAQAMLAHIEGVAPVAQQPMPQEGPSVKRRRVETTAPMLQPAPAETHGGGLRDSGEDGTMQCTICHETCTGHDSAQICQLPCRCRSRFHSTCIIPWLKKKPNCPVCRENVKLEQPNGPDAPEFRFVPGPPVGEDSGESSEPCTVDEAEEEAEAAEAPASATADPAAEQEQSPASTDTVRTEDIQMEGDLSQMELSFLNDDRPSENAPSGTVLDDCRALSFSDEVVFDGVSFQDFIDSTDICGSPFNS